MTINFQTDNATKPISIAIPTKKRGAHKKRLVTLIVALVLILASSVYGSYYYFFRNDSDNSDSIIDNNSSIAETLKNQNPEPPKPVYIQSPINGLMIEESKFNAIKTRPILAVIIQNHIASRPEFGLNEADVVYETLAEGGITRFMGVFWSEEASKVMSVRSARKYFVDLLGDYNKPAFMHIGYADGADNVSAIKAIRNNAVRDLENLRGSYERDLNCQKTKAVEHCAYSSTTKLWELAASANWTSDITQLTSWKFKEKNEPTKIVGKEVTDFTTKFSGLYANDYSVTWKYNAEKGKYLRFNSNGTPYLDGNGTQVETEVVIYQKITSYLSGDSKGHMVQEVIGSGTGYVMQGGKSYSVTWKKPTYASRTQFFDATTGEEFVFNRGKQWFMLVTKANDYIDNTPKPTLSPSETPVN